MSGDLGKREKESIREMVAVLGRGAALAPVPADIAEYRLCIPE